MLGRQLRAHRALQPTPTSNNVQASISQKQKPSLLFTPGEASTYNLRTIYELGLNGIEEIINLQNAKLQADRLKWIKYRESLFSKSMLNTERHLQGKEANDKLNIALNDILLELGPYFLKRCAHKVLEFLIRHYSVHIYNADALLTSALPYHQTETFVRVVCLPVNTDDPKWVFLKTLQQQHQRNMKNRNKEIDFSASLSRPNLLKACIKNMALMRKVVSIASEKRLSILHPAAISFSTIMISQFIDSCPSEKLEQQAMSFLLPGIVYALKRVDNSSLQKLGYISASLLAERVNLDVKAAQLILIVALNYADNGEDAVEDALRCAAMVFVLSDLKLTDFPQKAVDLLLQREQYLPFAMKIGFVNEKMAEPFIFAVYFHLFKRGLDGLRLADKLIGVCSVPKLKVGEMLDVIYQEWMAMVAHDDEKKSYMQSIVRKIAFAEQDMSDKALDDILLRDNVQANEDTKTATFEFISSCFGGGKQIKYSQLKFYDDSKEISTTLYLGLNHKAASVRIASLNMLFSSIQAFDDTSKRETMENLSDVIVERVRDDNWKVSSKAMRVAAEGLLNSSYLDEVVAGISRWSGKSTKATVSALKWLRSIDIPPRSHQRVFDLLISMFPSKMTESVKDVAVVIASIKTAEVISNLGGCFCLFKALTKAIDTVVGGKKATENVDVAKLYEIFAVNIENAASNDEILAGIKNTPKSVSRTVASLLHRILDTTVTEALIIEQMARATSGEVLSHKDFANQLISRVISKIQKVSDSNGSGGISLPFRALLFLLAVDSVHYEDVQVHIESLIHGYIKDELLFNIVATFAGGYSLFLSEYHSTKTESIQLRALNLCTSFVSALSNRHKKALSFEFLLPVLLICMNHECKLVRQSALECTEAVNISIKKKTQYDSPGLTLVPKPKNSTLKPLFERLERAKREIIVEPSSIQRLFGTFFSSKTNSLTDLDKDCKESIKYIVSFVTALFNAYPPSTKPSQPKRIDDVAVDLDTSEYAAYGMFSVGLNILRILKDTNVCALGPETWDLVKLSVEADPVLEELFALGTNPWKNPNCPVGDQEAMLLIFAQRKTFNVKGSKVCMQALELLNLPHIYNKLTKRIRSKLFEEMCNVIILKDRKSFSEASLKALKVLAELPFDEDIILEYLEKQTPKREIVLEAIRMRIVKVCPRSVALYLIEPLFNVMRTANDAEMEIASFCITQCLKSIRENEAKSNLHVNELEIDVDFIVKCTLSAKTSQVRSTLLALLAESGKWFPRKSQTAIVPILEEIRKKSSADTWDDSYTYLVFEQITLCLFPTVSADSTSTSSEKYQLVEVINTYIKVLFVHEYSLEKNLNLLHLVVQKSSAKCETLWVVVMMILSKGEEYAKLAHSLMLRFETRYQVQALRYLIDGSHLVVPMSLKLKEDGEDGTLIVLPLHHVAKLCSLGQNAYTGDIPFASRIALFVSDHLGLKPFIKMILSLTTEEVEKADLQGENGFLGLLQSLLRQIHRSGGNIVKAEELMAEVRFWRVFRDQLCIVLDRLNSLLSVPMFVAVVSELLQDRDAHVRHLALRQLSTKVEEEHSYWGDEEVVVFLEMLISLHAIIADDEEEEEDVNKQTALLCIDILARYLAIGEHKKQFAKVVPSVISILISAQKQVTIKPLENHSKIQLLSSACLCLGTLTRNIKELILAQIPLFFPSLLSSFELQFSVPLNNNLKNDKMEVLMDAYDMLSESSSNGLYAVVSTVPEFLSPYLERLIKLIIRCWQDTKETTWKTGERIGDVLAVAIEPRLLHAPLCEATIDLIQSGEVKSLMAARACLQVLETSIEPMPQSVVKQQLSHLSHFFPQTLDVRGYVSIELNNGKQKNDTSNNEEAIVLGLAELEKFEKQLVKTLLTFVMLLSERQLRTLFDDLCHTFWMSKKEKDNNRTDNGSDTVDSDAILGTKKRKIKDLANGHGKRKKMIPIRRWSRVATFYLFCSTLSERLGGIFVPFLDKIFNDLVLDLSERFPDSFNDQSEAWLARERALHTLGYFFTLSSGTQTSDGRGYMDKAQFDQVMAPLVNQLDLSSFIRFQENDGSKKRKADVEQQVSQYYTSYITEHVKTCLVKLAFSQTDSSNWQTLHHAILEHTHHELPVVRHATLLVISTMFEQVGDEYIVLLADTLPSLAELLEDEDEKVRSLAHKTANKLEQLSGEDLKELLKS